MSQSNFHIIGMETQVYGMSAMNCHEPSLVMEGKTSDRNYLFLIDTPA